MGRTLPSITQVFHMEEESLKRFRRALRRSDQLALDELFTEAQKHLAPAAYAADLQPMEIFLMAMLLEEHKTTQKLKAQLEVLKAQVQAQDMQLKSSGPQADSGSEKP